MAWDRIYPIEIEQTIVALATSGRTPAQIAEDITVSRQYVYYILGKRGIDWATTTTTRKLNGRPKKPLLLGQQVLCEALYTTPPRMAQYDIAGRLLVSPNRVKRHLVERGLFVPAPPDPGRVKNLLAAVSDYVNGDKVQDILERHRITAPDLYGALHTRGVELRGKPGRPAKQRPTGTPAEQ